jgi:predicted patatin/cPLA2 family phospholipase
LTSITRILEGRRDRGSRAPHGDGASVALSVEGGAMRGVISAGMVDALEDLGLVHAFDAVYGSSAGAVNAAYFLSGQAGIGHRIYFEDINNRQFIDLTRPIRKRPIVDLGYLFDDVVIRRKPLEINRILDSPTPLSVLATDVETRTATSLNGFGSRAQLLGALRAGATMPIIAGGPHLHEGRLYLDASLSEPIPVPSAEAAGHTHILVLLTRSGIMMPRPSALDRYFVAPRLRRLSPELADGYLHRARPYVELLSVIDAGFGPARRAHVRAIRTPGVHISRLERRRHVLEDAARRGYEAVMQTFRS